MKYMMSVPVELRAIPSPDRGFRLHRNSLSARVAVLLGGILGIGPEELAPIGKSFDFKEVDFTKVFNSNSLEMKVAVMAMETSKTILEVSVAINVGANRWFQLVNRQKVHYLTGAPALPTFLFGDEEFPFVTEIPVTAKTIEEKIFEVSRKLKLEGNGGRGKQNTAVTASFEYRLQKEPDLNFFLQKLERTAELISEMGYHNAMRVSGAAYHTLQGVCNARPDVLTSAALARLESELLQIRGKDDAAADEAQLPLSEEEASKMVEEIRQEISKAEELSKGDELRDLVGLEPPLYNAIKANVKEVLQVVDLRKIHVDVFTATSILSLNKLLEQKKMKASDTVKQEGKSSVSFVGRGLASLRVLVNSTGTKLKVAEEIEVGPGVHRSGYRVPCYSESILEEAEEIFQKRFLHRGPAFYTNHITRLYFVKNRQRFLLLGNTLEEIALVTGIKEKMLKGIFTYVNPPSSIAQIAFDVYLNGIEDTLQKIALAKQEV